MPPGLVSMVRFKFIGLILKNYIVENALSASKSPSPSRSVPDNIEELQNSAKSIIKTTDTCHENQAMFKTQTSSECHEENEKTKTVEQNVEEDCCCRL